MTLLPELMLACTLAFLILPVLLLYWLGTDRLRCRVVCMVAIAFVLMCLLTQIALAFPENIRHGYPSCTSCHVSPSGGGVLTPYGRGAAASVMSTWSAEGEEQPLGFLKLPDWAAVGGDARYINANLHTRGLTTHRKFWMQYDLELAVFPAKPITFAALIGRYGEKQREESRRNYMKLQFGDLFSLRAGRFMPAYGIAFPDHRLPTRAGLGFGEGQETYNIEGSVIGRYGELFVTGIYGNDTGVGMARDGYSVATDTGTGIASKAAFYVGDTAQVGVSHLAVSAVDHYRHAVGAFATVGITHYLYLLAEYDRKYEDGETVDLGVGRLGVEPVRGLNLSLIGELQGKQRAAGLQLQWLPRPHWEILGEVKRTKAEKRYIDSGILMFHYYL